LSIDGQLGYGYGQLPALDASAGTVRALPVSHYGPMLALAVGGKRGELFSGRLSARVAPFSYAASVLGPARASEYAVGAEVAIGSLLLSGMKWGGVVGYEYGHTRALGSSGSGFGLPQNAHPLGVGLRAALPRAEQRVGKL